jgi:Domain of unknown function (DUF4407)
MSAINNGRQNGSLSYDSFSRNFRKSDSHFLWWCAGSHQPSLKDCPTEHTKHAGLGGVLLATFVLASLSAGYAIYSVFKNPLWAILFGVIWGLIIFNFDRFLVSTMRKYGVSPAKQIWIAVPRIILALLIGITISRPLELKIFEQEINTKVAENRHHKILLNDSLLRAENKTAISNAEKERGRLIDRKLLIEDTLHRLQAEYIREADGTGGSLHRGIEKLTLLKQQAYQAAFLQFTPELQQLSNQIGYQDSILTGTTAENEIKRKQYEEAVTVNVGFLERNKALSDLSTDEASVFWANFFISLLIILIEIGPVLSKLMMTLGPYDMALSKTELLQMSTTENEIQRDKELLFDKLSGIYEKKKEMSDDLIQRISTLQQKHINNELDRWERGERITNDKTAIDELLKRLKNQYDFKEENIL